MTIEMILYYVMWILFIILIVLFVIAMAGFGGIVHDQILTWKYNKEMREIRKKDHEKYLKEKAEKEKNKKS